MYFGNICRRRVDVVKGGRCKAKLLLIGWPKITQISKQIFPTCFYSTSELSPYVGHCRVGIKNSDGDCDWFGISFIEIGLTTVDVFAETYLIASVYLVKTI